MLGPEARVFLPRRRRSRAVAAVGLAASVLREGVPEVSLTIRIGFGLPLLGEQAVRQMQDFFQSVFQVPEGRTVVAELLIANGA